MSANPKTVESELTPFKLLINGKLVPGATSTGVINPATGKSFVSCPRADIAQLNEAVAAAKAAFPAWSRKSWEERRRLLLALADALSKKSDEFAALLTQEQGKPFMQAQFEMGGAIAMIHAFAEMNIVPKVLKEDATQKIVLQPRAARRRRGDHPVELPDDPADDQGRARAAGRQHRGRKARAHHAANYPASSASWRRRSCRRAYST